LQILVGCLGRTAWEPVSSEGALHPGVGGYHRAPRIRLGPKIVEGLFQHVSQGGKQRFGQGLEPAPAGAVGEVPGGARNREENDDDEDGAGREPRLVIAGAGWVACNRFAAGRARRLRKNPSDPAAQAVVDGEPVQCEPQQAEAERKSGDGLPTGWAAPCSHGLYHCGLAGHEDVHPQAHADHHEHEVEADRHVDEAFGGPAGASRADGHRSGGGDGHRGEQHDERSEAEQRTPSRTSHRASTLHRLVRRPPLTECWPRPSVMGVVNVTPDSFSDGGDNFDPAVAVATAHRLFAEGAALVDIGGESTRPGAEPVPVEEELRRVLPVLEQLSGLPVSIDTSKAEVARRALELGVALVNDVTALRADPALAGVIADAGAYVCLMHMQGEPRTMQSDPRYDDVVGEVAGFLEDRLAVAVAAGIPEEHVCLDPGIGFGKTPDQNLELIRGLERICRIGRPVLVGLSRKSTLARVIGDRDGHVGGTVASVGAAVAAFDRGAALFRAHDVAPHVEALTVAAAIERGRVA